MNLANRLTVLRILLVPFFVASLVYYSREHILLFRAGVMIFVLACMTDAADGYFARKLNQKSQLGSYIDPLADKLLLLSGYLCLGFIGHLPEAMKVPAWLSIIVISRDIMILLGATMIYVITGGLNVKPLWISKLTTVLQMMTLFFSLVMMPALFQGVSFALTAIVTVISGVVYLSFGGQMLKVGSK